MGFFSVHVVFLLFLKYILQVLHFAINFDLVSADDQEGLVQRKEGEKKNKRLRERTKK